MEQQQYDAIIIGAGLAGLTAALHLEKYNLRPLIIDKDERVGGRIKTDEIDGFLLDRGFQVILEDYPILQEYLNLKDLYLQSFEPGAILFNDTEKFKVRDVRRKPFSALAMAFSPVGTFMDKVRLGNMVTELQNRMWLPYLQSLKPPRLITFKSGALAKRLLSASLSLFLRAFTWKTTCKPHQECLSLYLNSLVKGTPVFPHVVWKKYLNN
jgi:phytoene dehydrogenase-like protein